MIDRLLLMTEYVPYYRKVVMMIPEDDDAVEKYRHDARFEAVDFYQCPGSEHMHWGFTKQSRIDLDAKIYKGYLSYKCVGDMMKKHGMAEDDPARGILFHHADLWMYPWQLANANFDIPWLFDGDMKPLSEMPPNMAVVPIGEFAVPDCTNCSQEDWRDDAHPWSAKQMHSSWYFNTVSRSLGASKALCRDTGIGCLKNHTGSTELPDLATTCFGWADGFYYPATVFKPNNGCALDNSDCDGSSLFDQVLQPFVKQQIFHETAVRTIGHLLGSALPGGDTPQGVGKISCFGGCCAHGTVQDMQQYTCGHKMALQDPAVQKLFTAMLRAGGSDNSTEALKGGFVQPSASPTEALQCPSDLRNPPQAHVPSAVHDGQPMEQNSHAFIHSTSTQADPGSDLSNARESEIAMGKGCTPEVDSNCLPIILVLAWVVGTREEKIAKFNFLLEYAKYYMQVVFQLEAVSDDDLAYFQHQLPNADFVQYPGWEMRHRDFDKWWFVKRDNHQPGYEQHYRPYEVAGDMLKKHGMTGGKKARGVLYHHADMWVHPWALKGADLDRPWLFDGYMRPVPSNHSSDGWKRHTEQGSFFVGEWDMPDCTTLNKREEWTAGGGPWENLIRYPLEMVERAQRASKDVCLKEGIGCIGETQNVTACFGWSDAFYYPRTAFDPPSDCAMQNSSVNASQCESLYDRVLRQFVLHDIWHDTGVRTVGHILAAALPGGSISEGPIRIHCFGGCCTGEGTLDDITGYVCGHKMAIHHEDVQKTLTDLLRKGPSADGPLVKGGLYPYDPPPW